MQTNDVMAGINQKKSKKPRYKHGELLVKYRAYVGASSAKLGHKAINISTIRTFKKIGVQHVNLPEGMNVEQALDLYQMNPDVDYAEPNHRYHTTIAPNDTYFNWLWGLHNTGQDVNGTSGTSDADIDAPEAWDITTGSSQVIVAVVDSGVDYNHPDLASNIWTNPGETPDNEIDDDGNGKIDDVRGWDFVDNDNDPMDYTDHGTHVAGTIAAVGNNSTGVTGVSWSTQIMVIRGLGTDGSGWTSDLIEAIEYASSKGAHVINNSWGGADFSQALEDTIAASSAVVVCAAGNDDLDNDSTPHYPSTYECPNIIAVAATNQSDNRASFSNYGAVSVDVAAPGTNIYSTIPIRQTIWSDDFDDGTISDWTTDGTNNTWGLTSSVYHSYNYSLADSPTGNYQNHTNSWARPPSFNLSSHKGTRLDFNGKGSTEEYSDYLYIETSSDGTTWTEAGDPFSGSTYDTWYPITADLTALDGSSTGYVRFRFDTNFSAVYDGCYIDDMTVTVASTAYDRTSEYEYKQGTSMATPIVSGIAALLKAYKPALTNTDIKAIIENNVDPKTSLTGKMVTGGRVNAFNALDSLKIDIDDDNDVDIKDAVLALQVVAGTTPSNIRPDYVSSFIDVNGDNQIGMEEVIYILQVVVGIR